jgi:succinate dehydrogenase / fumarate reductase cytochrome b subunit
MTVGVTAGLGYAHDHVDVYGNMVRSYRVPWMVAISVVGSLVFGSHLYHGAWSLFQSLGVSHPRHNRRLRRSAMGIALLVTAGFVAIPLAVLAGLVG